MSDLSTLCKLVIEPSWVMVTTGSDGSRWITDRKVIFKDYLVNAVFRDLPDGLYELKATRPPAPLNTALVKLSDLEAMHRSLGEHEYSPVHPPEVPVLHASPGLAQALFVVSEDGRLATVDYPAWNAWHRYAGSLHGSLAASLSEDGKFLRFDLLMSGAVTIGWAFLAVVPIRNAAEVLGRLASAGGYRQPADAKDAA
jgi:hypothetical protein